MTKKRLEDLLREEAGKPVDAETEALPDPVLEQKPVDATAAELELPAENAEPGRVDAIATPRPKRTNPTKADLEATLTELQAALQAAHQTESALQQQVAELQLELQEQKPLVEKLQTELEQAKAMVLKLSETNAGTTQETSSKKRDKDFRSQQLSLKKLPHHVTPLEMPSKKLSDREIGWFD